VKLDGGTGPGAHASCASNCFTCSQTCAIAQCALGAYRPGVPGGRRRASRRQEHAAACAPSRRRRLRLLGGSHATCVADRTAVASCIALARRRRTPRSATACARRSRRTHAQ
jgi:hypothetical protein